MKYEILTSLAKFDQSGTFLQVKVQEAENRFGVESL